MPALLEHKQRERSFLGWRGAHQYQLLLLRPMCYDGWLQALSSLRSLELNSQSPPTLLSRLYCTNYLAPRANPTLGRQDAPWDADTAPLYLQFQHLGTYTHAQGSHASRIFSRHGTRSDHMTADPGEVAWKGWNAHERDFGIWFGRSLE